jgi:predicted aminopeptidase
MLLIKYNLVYYAYVQAKGQLNIIIGSVKVSEVMDDVEFPDSLKAKISLIEEVKQFAVNELGLKGIKNYTSFYDQKGKELMWVVSACPPFELEAFEWKFPLIGTFSFKGYFIKEMAEEEAEKLKKMGLDVNIRTADGWSTLGILKDPILSNMLMRNEGSLADLIIHELTHGTIFVRDSLAFNENLASFIGKTGARIFLYSRFGQNSQKLSEFNIRTEDLEFFTEYVLNGADMLDSLYSSFSPDESYELKMQKKEEVLNSFREGIKRIDFNNKEFYYHYFDDFTPDNTFFMSYIRYRGEQSIFENELKNSFEGDLAKYIEKLKSQFEK